MWTQDPVFVVGSWFLWFGIGMDDDEKIVSSLDLLDTTGTPEDMSVPPALTTAWPRDYGRVPRSRHDCGRDRRHSSGILSQIGFFNAFLA